MSWLRPEGRPSTMFVPNERVEAFVKDEGLFGAIVLEAFDEADPLRCGIVPDEYLGYAKRFVEALPKAQLTSNKPEALELFTEVVRRSFSANQIAENWVSLESVEAIAKTIYEEMQRHGPLNTSERL